MATKKKTTVPKKAKEKPKAKPKPKEKVLEENPFVSTYGNIDSKFRFVHLASKRAKSLLKGAKPKLKARAKSPIRLAQVEVKEGLIDYRIIPSSLEEIPEKDDRSFLGGDGVGAAEVELESDEAADLGEAEEAAHAEEEEEKEEEYEEELPEGFAEEDKEEN